MTDEEILQLRKAILVIYDKEEALRLIQLLYTELNDSPWTSCQLEIVSNKFDKEHSICIDINNNGYCWWSASNWYKSYSKYSTYTYYNITKPLKGMSVDSKESRNISISIDQAKEWYNGTNETLKQLALIAYNERELILSYDQIRKHQESIYPSSITTLVEGSSPKTFLSILNLIKLKHTADYFNKDWKMEVGKTGYFINKVEDFNGIQNTTIGRHETACYPGIVYFKNKKDLEQAINILQKVDAEFLTKL